VRLGAHVSTAGGLANAPVNGRAIGADVIQIFTRNQRQWRARPVTDAEAEGFRAACRAQGIARAFAHASYLLNLASPDRATRRASRAALVAEIQRSALLGIGHVILHPGAHMGAGPRAGVETAAESLDAALEEAGRPGVRLLVEGTAGQGTCIGSTFAELAGILAAARHSERLGVCLDTCHLFAAGHDLGSDAGLAATLRAFARTVGFGALGAVHVNDALLGLGSRRDRHAPLGEGRLGRPAFRRIVRARRLARVPLILETPGPERVWRREIALLRRLAARPSPGLRGRASRNAR
jgi:deoxyribonuclease-4